MDLDGALGDIQAIRGALARRTRFEGYSAMGVGASALLAAGAGLYLARVGAADTPAMAEWRFLTVWSEVLVLAMVVNAAGILWNVTARRMRLRDSNLLPMLAAMTPPLLAGGVLTLALVRAEAVSLLPAVWMLNYGLCLYSLRGIGPKGVEWLGAGAFACGVYGLLALETEQLLNPAYMGGVFAVCQGLGAALIWEQDVRVAPIARELRHD